jgi:hypothetical protein
MMLDASLVVALASAASAVAPPAAFNTFFLFASQLAVGAAAALLVVPVARIGRRFFILMTFFSILFVAFAIAARGLQTGYLYLIFAALLILYNVTLPRQSGVDVSAHREESEGGPKRRLTVFAQAVLWAAVVVGWVALVYDAQEFPQLPLAAASGVWLTPVFLTSSFLLGSSLVAMVLGHWYLVLRKLSFEPLRRATLLVMVSLAARILVAVISAGLQAEQWDELLRRGWTAFLLDPGIFVLTRIVFGFVAPAALAWMTWRCVQIHSNQSATGILYVNLAFVLIGEIIAKYFLVSAQLIL